MSTERHRHASIDIVGETSTSGPVQLTLRAKVNDDYQKRVYQVLDSMQEAQRTGKPISLPVRNATSEGRGNGPNVNSEWSPPPTHSTEPTNMSLSADSLDLDSGKSPLVGAGWTDAAGTQQLPSRAKLWATLAVVIVSSGAAVYAWLYFRDRRPVVPQHSSIEVSDRDSANGLGLRVRPQRGAFVISWNRQNRKIRLIKQGTLEIIDGPRHRRIPLDSNEMAVGSVLYTSSSRDMIIRLTLSNGNDPADSEEVRVVAGSISQPQLDTKDSGPTALADMHSQVGLSPIASPAIPARPSMTQPSVQQTQLASAERGERNDAHSIDPNSSTSKGGSNKFGSASPPMPNGRVSDNPRSHSLATQEPMVDRSRTSGTQDGVRPMPEFAPPQAIKRVMPTGVSTALRINNPVHIDIQVRIDESGRVIDARPANGAAEENQQLLRASIAAAKQWAFQPAMMKGRPVASDALMEFRFGPKHE
jgi:hypothetical protein